jgi:hypothetical protein
VTIAAAHKASVYDSANASTYVTGSWTPTADRLVLACVENARTGTPTTPTLSGNGLTWTQVATYVCDTVDPQFRITVFVAKTGATPSAGAVTVAFGGVSQIGGSIIVDELDVAYLSGTDLDAIVQSKTGSVDASGTSESISLNSAITSGNASYGLIFLQHANAVTPGSGHSALGAGNHTGPVAQLVSIFKAAGSQTVDASWGTSAGKGGIAVEVKAAASGQTVTVNQASETDSVQAITVRKQKAIGQSSETDSTQTVAAQRRYAVALVSETDATQAITFASQHGVGQASETDTAQSITPAKRVAINQASETDTAQLITNPDGGEQIVSVEQVVETDSAQPIGKAKVRVVSQVAETDLVQQLFPSKRIAVAQVLEVDLAQIITRIKRNTIGQTGEIDAAQGLTAQRRYAVAIAVEADSVFSMMHRKALTVGVVAESDDALAVTMVGPTPVPTPAASDSIGRVTREWIRERKRRIKYGP